LCRLSFNRQLAPLTATGHCPIQRLLFLDASPLDLDEFDHEREFGVGWNVLAAALCAMREVRR
jgi:hypothetical protein